MVNPKKPLFLVSKSKFETAIWPELEKELRVEMEAESTPLGGATTPAGGMSSMFDSLTAVCVVELIIPTFLGASPPAEKIIRAGGYVSIDDFVTDIRPKLLALCPDEENKESIALNAEVAE